MRSVAAQRVVLDNSESLFVGKACSALASKAMNSSLREKFGSSEDARLWAQFIAFAPFVFQTGRSLRDLGILNFLGETADGAAFAELRERSGLSDYSLQVLLDAGESCGLVYAENGKYLVAPAGRFLASDPLTNVNMNFTNDICYEGLRKLPESLRSGKPEGLSVFGDWATIYSGLTELPPQALRSWLDFDHHFSDDAFPKALSLLSKDAPRRILDVGGNTGKFAIACARFNPAASITMLDHPRQLELARKNIVASGLEARIERMPMDLLDHSRPFPKGYDTIWMSQFLDCFGKRDILGLFRRAREAMSETANFSTSGEFLTYARIPPNRMITK